MTTIDFETIDERVEESKRLLASDARKALDGSNLHLILRRGFRMRCRFCLEEEQVNLPGHAAQTMAKHESCMAQT